EIAALTGLAKKNGLTLVFDAAHALGSSYHGKPIGSFGAAEVFSFHATKFVNTGEGGAITTNDDALAAKLRAERRFGFDNHEPTIDLGTNGKMAEICAAMGLTYLDSFDELRVANAATHAQYKTELSDIPGISLLPLDKTGACNHQYIVTTVDEALAGLSRDDLLRVLEAENILAKRYFYPGCHRIIAGKLPQNGNQLPVTERLTNSVLVLPGGASMKTGEIHRVCETIRLAASHGAEIHQVFTGSSSHKTVSK
ncbi:MAG TPA: DegT/DnrJ/EryC1/StrS family aminotransferase, partial [Terriglobales bacterium]|nr:DegT/DnrJ/EryC1/StrS family aminotransferase [Terriglobales bacterium]